MPQKISDMMKMNLIILKFLKNVLMSVIFKIVSLNKKLRIPNIRS